MIEIETAKFEDGRATVVITDAAEFQRIEPGSFGRNTRRAVEVGGRFYLLAPDCPDDGLAVWSADGSDEEASKDAAIVAARARLTAEQLAAVGLADAKTRSEKVAQKLADDAEAEARRVAAEAAKAET